ncbi:MAG: stage III sporulation protein AC [Eubacteriaceae bacterium]|nr:stage III sporulation protein AC [Eubacteriaceae bacterium]
MNIDIIFRIAGVGVIITLVNQILTKNGRDDIATLVTLVGVIIVLLTVIEIISGFFETLKTTFGIY